MAVATTVTDFATQVQPGVWKQLKVLAASGNIANGYIFTGPAGTGKEGTALSFAALLNCTATREKPCGTCSSCRRFNTLQHEHLTLVYPLPGGTGPAGDTSDPLERLSDADLEILTRALEKKAQDPFYRIQLPRANRIPIQFIRHLRHKIYLKSAEPGFKIIILFAAHTLSAGSGEAANALLKLLEEPPADTTLILVTDQRDVLLPTILSRCQLISFPPLTMAAITRHLGTDTSQPVDLAAYLSGGDINAARRLAAQPENDMVENLLAMVRFFMAANMKEQRAMLGELVRLVRSEPDVFRQTVTALQFWFSLLQKTGAGLPLPKFSAPLQPSLTATAARYPKANVPDIIITLEELKQAPQQNLHPELALTGAVVHIRRYLSGLNRYAISRQLAP
ncbi:MAG: ATP-binding protein [Fidelibacterota bacterium]